MLQYLWVSSEQRTASNRDILLQCCTCSPHICHSFDRQCWPDSGMHQSSHHTAGPLTRLDYSCMLNTHTHILKLSHTSTKSITIITLWQNGPTRPQNLFFGSLAPPPPKKSNSATVAVFGNSRFRRRNRRLWSPVWTGLKGYRPITIHLCSQCWSIRSSTACIGHIDDLRHQADSNSYQFWYHMNRSLIQSGHSYIAHNLHTQRNIYDFFSK